jgi:hypothetical protein
MNRKGRRNEVRQKDGRIRDETDWSASPSADRDDDELESDRPAPRSRRSRAPVRRCSGCQKRASLYRHALVPGAPGFVWICLDCHATLHGAGPLEVPQRQAYAAALRERFGYDRGGDPPYGKRRVPGGGLEDDPAEQAAVARIVDLFGRGISARWITRLLRGEGVLNRRGGTRWHPTTIARIAKRAGVQRRDWGRPPEGGSATEGSGATERGPGCSAG